MIYLIETYINCLYDEVDKKKKYLDTVWNLLQKSYAKIGGTAGLDNPNELLENKYFWKMVRKNGEIVAVCIYKKSPVGGRKMSYCGTNQTPEGKTALYNIISEDVKLKDRNTWGEVSDAMEHIYLHKFNGVPIRVEIAQKVMNKLGKQIIPCEDGYHYKRVIGDQEHTKIMFGNLPDGFDTDDVNTLKEIENGTDI